MAATWTVITNSAQTFVIGTAVPADYQTVISALQMATTNPSLANTLIFLTPATGFPIGVRIGAISTIQQLT